MSFNTTGNALNKYRDVGVKASVESASPHRLVALLLDGALGRVNSALGHLQRGTIAAKAKEITVALSIVGGLRGCLDMERGGDIADNLDALYDYIQRRLLVANARNDAGALEEVGRLLREVKAGWEGIDPQAPRAGQSPAATSSAAAR